VGLREKDRGRRGGIGRGRSHEASLRHELVREADPGESRSTESESPSGSGGLCVLTDRRVGFTGLDWVCLVCRAGFGGARLPVGDGFLRARDRSALRLGRGGGSDSSEETESRSSSKSSSVRSSDSKESLDNQSIFSFLYFGFF
jgi:hypothetical protein